MEYPTSEVTNNSFFSLYSLHFSDFVFSSDLDCSSKRGITVALNEEIEAEILNQDFEEDLVANL